MSTLKQEFDHLIDEHGVYYVLISRMIGITCTNCTGREPDSKCPVCLGLGYKVQIKPILARTSTPWKPDFQEQGLTPIGILGDQSMIFYVKSEDRPKERDRLLEVTWSVPREHVMKKGQILAIHHVYSLERVEPKHGEHGDLSYYRIGAHDIDVGVSWLLELLKNRTIE